MIDLPPSDTLEAVLLSTLDEIFETQHGIFLDENTSLFHTLAAIPAEKASIPVGGKCATLAAQVAHATFFVTETLVYMRTGQYPDSDWGEIWRNVSAVTEQEWQTLQQELNKAFHDMVELFKNAPAETLKARYGGTIAIIAHSAYHLGEIRQALCTLS
jgi:hypothetical protein